LPSHSPEADTEKGSKHRMSENQYYEFRALDRRLTAEQQQQQQRQRSLSSRADISAARFTSEYSFVSY
jgi:hypothetical protein